MVYKQQLIDSEDDKMVATRMMTQGLSEDYAEALLSSSLLSAFSGAFGQKAIGSVGADC